MSATNIYTIKQLKELCKEQSYKFACLYNDKDKKINNFNTLQTPVAKHLDVIDARLKNQILPDGIYFVALSSKLGNGQIIDKYPIMKGKMSAENNAQVIQVLSQQPQESVLSYQSALQMQKDIASWETKYLFLEAQNKLLAEKNEELKKEVKELEDALSEYEDGQGNARKSQLAEFGEKAGGWLKEIAPMLAPLADRYFDSQDKKIALEEKKIDATRDIELAKSTKKTNNNSMKKLEVGGPAFLEYIRELHEDEESEEELNKCLDLLEQNFPDQYNEICEELDLFEEEEEEEEEENDK